jgi:transcriptional regulator with XRE-family HTH domain
MLPIKMDLTEKVAATLRELRLEYPVNGEILTAEKLSKAIGNNRAWMSQIESRRLKKIKREDIIKIYKLLHNENDDKKAEQIAEADLCSPFETRYNSDKNGEHFVNDSFSEGIISLDNLISELRDIFLDEYKKRTNSLDRNALLGTIESMISNFQSDFKHTNTIYTAPISYADPEYFGEKYAKEYYKSLDDVAKNYILNLHEAFEKADTDSFLSYVRETYSDLLKDINTIDSNTSLEDMMDLVMWIDSFNRHTFTYIDRIKSGKHHKTTISLDELFNIITNLSTAFLNKLKLNYTYTIPIPTFKSSKSELDAKQLEISNAIMLIIKHISNK